MTADPIFPLNFKKFLKKRQSRLQVSSHCPTRCVRPSAFLGAFHFWRQKQLQKAQQGCGVQANKPVSIVKYRSISLSQQLSLRSATKHRNRPLAEIFPKKNQLIDMRTDSLSGHPSREVRARVARLFRRQKFHSFGD